MTEAPTTELMGARDAPETPDPELLNLPDPPKRDRTLTVALLLVTGIASLAMVLALRRDAAYAFASTSARDIGDLSTASSSALHENEYVQGHVALGAARAIRYERPLVSDSFRLMPVMRATPQGAAYDIWVEVRVPARGENVRWVPPSQVSGRLVRFENAGPRHRGLANAVRDVTGQNVPKDAWLLVDGSAPSDARWVVLLVGLFVSFAVYSGLVTARLLRKIET